MKKLFSVFVLLLLLVCAFSSCGHKHKYSENWSYDDSEHWHAMTCKHDGFGEKSAHSWDSGKMELGAECSPDTTIIFTCTVCGYQKNEQASEHIYAEAEVVPSTCEQMGYTVFECTRCESSYIGNYTDVLGHSFINKNVIKETTCTEDGVVFHACSVCGFEEEAIVPALGHKWDSDGVVSEPTCTEAGYINSVCTVCGEKSATKQDALGHKHGDMVYTDEMCNEQYVGYVACKVCNEIIYEFGHSYVRTTENATCTENGSYTYKCVYCEDEYVETINATGHIVYEWTLDVEPSCSSVGRTSLICVICNEVIETAELAKKEHSYSSAIVSGGISYSCVNCSDHYVVRSEASHKITFVSNGGTEFDDIYVSGEEVYNLPVPQKSGFEFIGWYFDEELKNSCPNEYRFSNDTTLYASWAESNITASVNTNNVIIDAPLDFTFKVKSNVALTNGNLSQYVNITDMDGSSVEAYILNSSGDEYTVASNEYLGGTKYSIAISDQLSFVESQGSEIWIITAGENHNTLKYNDGVVLISVMEVINLYTIDETVLLYLRNDRLNAGDVFVIYAESEDDVLYIASVESEYTERTSHVYKLAEADASSVFEEFEAYYSGELDLSNIEVLQGVEEAVEQAFVNSLAYARFEYSAIQFAATYSSNGCKYVYQGIETTVKLSPSGTNIVFTCSATAKFIRQDSSNQATGQEFAITFSTTITTKFDATLSAKSFSNFSLVVDNNTTINSQFIASFKHESQEREEINAFKKIFDQSKKEGKFDELDESSASAGKAIGIGKVIVPIVPGISFDVDLSINLNIDVVGELGISLQNHLSVKFGFEYKDGRLNTIKGFDSVSTLSVYVMGKMEVYAPMEARLSVSFLGCVHIYISFESGPYFDIGGMFVASLSSQGGSNAIFGGYIELGLQMRIKIGVSVTCWKMVTEWRTGRFGIKYPVIYFVEGYLINQSFQLFDMRIPMITLGTKEAVLYFKEFEDEMEIETDCDSYIQILDLIDKNVIVQNLDEMKQSVKEVECDVFFEGSASGLYITPDGRIGVNNKNLDSATVVVKIVHGNVHKYITLNIKINHRVLSVEAKDPTCTEKGNYAFSGCGDCGRIFSGDNTPIEPIGHDFVKQDDKIATCTDFGLTDYYVCSRCDYFKYTFVEPLGHIEIIDARVEPTCTQVGMTEGKHCSRCEEILIAQHEIPMIPHNESGWIIDLRPTCTAEGSRHKECTVCRTVLATETIPANGHTETEWIIDLAPTCIADGSKHKSCTVCRIVVVTETIPALGHDKLFHEAKEPTCIEIGWYAYETCTRCGYTTYVERSATGHTLTEWILDENNSGLNNCVWNPTYTRTCHCDYAEHKTEAPFGHDITSWSVVVAPTQDTTGLLERGCMRQGGCGNRESITLPTLTEENVTNGTYTVVITEPTFTSDGSEVYTYVVNGEHFSFTIVLPMKVASQGLQYTLNSDKSSYSVTGIGTCTDTHIVIPDIYNDLLVTAIGERAFDGRKKIVSVEIPNSVTIIGNNAFRNCNSLSSVIISNGVTNIGDFVFKYCSSLLSIIIPSSVENIGIGVFDGCSSLTDIFVSSSNPNYMDIDGNLYTKDCTGLIKYLPGKSTVAFEIPDSVTSIDYGAFEGCSSLVSVVIPAGVTSIGTSAFAGCSSLASVVIPNGVTSISYGMFSGCSSLESVLIPNGISTIGDYAFNHCASLTSIVMPDSVKSIGSHAFEDCSSLATVVISKGVTKIGDSAFTDCSLLKSIVLPNGVTQISNNVFNGCKLLQSIVIPDGVKSIGGYAFSGCEELTSIAIPNSVTSIGNGAFNRCKMITSIVIPDGVTVIGDYAFYYCYSLTGIIISDNLTSIGRYAFEGCSSLTNIVIPAGVTNIGTCTFYGCSSLISIVIPNTVTSIDSGAFGQCSALTSVVIPDSVTSIGYSAFRDCGALADISVSVDNMYYKDIEGNLYTKDGKTLIQYAVGKKNTTFVVPSGVTTIVEESVSGCVSLSSVVIPDSVTSIGWGAFSDCSSLVSVSIGKEVVSIGSVAFLNCYKLAEVINKSGLTITVGSSDHGYVAYYALEVHNGDSKIVEYGDYLFYSYKGINYLLSYLGTSTSLALPENFNGEKFEIYDYAFYNSQSLVFVDIGNGVTKIGDYAFYCCDFLRSVIIGDSVTEIDNYSFDGCHKLNEVINKSSLDIRARSSNYGYIARNAIEVHSVASKIVNIDNFLFYTYNGVNYLIGYIGTNTSLVLPESFNGQNYQIGTYAFDGCHEFTSIVIPVSVTYIGYYAFYSCGSLTDVYYTCSKEDINISFGMYNYSLNGATAHYNYVA